MPKNKVCEKYGRTSAGQQLYDLGFSNLTERWLARKYGLPVAEVRLAQQAVRDALKPRRKTQGKIARRKHVAQTKT